MARGTLGRARLGIFLAAVACALAAAAPVLSAAPPRVELRGRGETTVLPLVVLDDDSGFVAAERLAAALKGRWAVRGGRGTLTVGERAAVFTQGRPSVVVVGRTVPLASAPRAGAGGWLLPEDFLRKGLGRLVPGMTASRAAVPTTRASTAAPARPAVAFEDIRLRSYPSFTRIVIEAAGTLPYAIYSRGNEVRMRLHGLALAAPQVQEVDDGLVKEVRLEPAGADAVLRVTLGGPAERFKDFELQEPFRIVLDIFRRKEAAVPGAARPAQEPLRLIVLDAGHGGHDPGAIGPTGLQEKEVVLDVTRRVARMVEEGLGVKVALTRSEDTFVPLRDRTNFANKQRADLFVSIHANAHPRSVSEGVETYFLSSEASDSEARQAAAFENAVVQLEGPASRPRNDLLKTILWDLAQSEFQQESGVLAETVLDKMTRSLRLVNRGVKQAGFYVLGGAAMPAILIEIGFLTNPREERKLRAPEHREATARAIYEGLAEYRRRWEQRMRGARAGAPVEARAPEDGKAPAGEARAR